MSTRQDSTKTNQNNTRAESFSTAPQEEGIRINGLEQVVELLKFADPAFRESLIKRLNQRDPQLAARLRRHYR